MTEFEGRCLCGAVGFAIAPPTLFFAHCHCRDRREAHGAAFVSWVGSAEERFRFLPGSAEPRWYASSQQSRRGFCPTCGTTLFFASTLCPGEIHVVRTAILARSTASRNATSSMTSAPRGAKWRTACRAMRPTTRGSRSSRP